MVLGVKMPDNFSYSLRHLRKMKLFWVRYQVNIEYSNLVERKFVKIYDSIDMNDSTTNHFMESEEKYALER